MTAVDAAGGRVPGVFARYPYGGDYNPEQWPVEVHAEDVELMRRAGVTMVSVGIFGWAKAEPAPGQYDFDWLEDVLDRLAANDIAVCLATMTASPPPWLASLHPETLPVTVDGTRLSPGSRQQYCPSSPIYRDHATRLVEQLAKRFGEHEALAMWHVGNEYGCHVRACYCDESALAFRRWLVERYGDIGELNRAWSTDFWSQSYGSFDEVLPPRVAPSFRNPAQQLDFTRFSSSEILACYLGEAELLRGLTPDVSLTTNFVPLAKTLDLFDWAPHLDVVSYDSYPDPADELAPMRASLGYDTMRGLRDGQSWLLMEQAPSAVNWREVNLRKDAGVMRLWSWQAVAHGAAAVMFFQWRQSRGGAEKFHSAMVPHGGAETPTFRRVSELGQELGEQAWLPGATAPPADVALLIDWDNWWAFELDAHPHNGMSYLDRVEAHYRHLYDADIPVDIRPVGADLSRYKLVVVPNLYLTSAETAQALFDYVDNGGTLLVSFFSGIVDEQDRVHLGGYPGPLRQLLGLCVQEFAPLAADDSLQLQADDGTPVGSATTWAEQVEMEGADVVWRFVGSELDGCPAVTRHRVGAGTAWYAATAPDEPTMRRLFDDVLRECDVVPLLPSAPAGVKVRRLQSAGGEDHLVVLNHSDERVDVDLPGSMRDLLTGQQQSRLSLDRHGVAVLRKDGGPSGRSTGSGTGDDA